MSVFIFLVVGIQWKCFYTTVFLVKYCYAMVSLHFTNIRPFYKLVYCTCQWNHRHRLLIFPSFSLSRVFILVSGGLQFISQQLVWCFVRMRTVLITQRCFSFCWAVLGEVLEGGVHAQSQELSSFLCCPASGEPGDAQVAGRGQDQDSWAKLAEGISQTILHHSEW